jgi:hypothetical protein
MFSKATPEVQAKGLRFVNDQVKDVILPRNSILEMTRDQTVNNAMRVRQLDQFRVQQISDAAQNLQRVMAQIRSRVPDLRRTAAPIGGVDLLGGEAASDDGWGTDSSEDSIAGSFRRHLESVRVPIEPPSREAALEDSYVPIPREMRPSEISRDDATAITDSTFSQIPSLAELGSRIPVRRAAVAVDPEDDTNLAAAAAASAAIAQRKRKAAEDFEAAEVLAAMHSGQINPVISSEIQMRQSPMSRLVFAAKKPESMKKGAAVAPDNFPDDVSELTYADSFHEDPTSSTQITKVAAAGGAK